MEDGGDPELLVLRFPGNGLGLILSFVVSAFAAGFGQEFYLADYHSFADVL